MKRVITIILLSVFILLLGLYMGDKCLGLEKSQQKLIQELDQIQEEKEQLKEELQAQKESSGLLVKKNELQSGIIQALRANLKELEGPPKGIKERLPQEPTNFISYMDYRKVTNTRSWQYQLLQECSPELYTGIYTYYHEGNHYKCVALGSAYGKDIGDAWKVTLENDSTFYIILTEYKDSGLAGSDFFGHTAKNYSGEDCINTIEFVVDSTTMSSKAKSFGTFNALEYYGGIYSHNGNIKEFKYIGRIWQPN